MTHAYAPTRAMVETMPSRGGADGMITRGVPLRAKRRSTRSNVMIARASAPMTTTPTTTTLTMGEARKRVDDGFARARFSPNDVASPLERCDRLSEYLGGPEIWMKRDDAYGTLSGGNKTRKLEYLMAEALELGATTVVTQGATQSNHARQTAAACARLGLACRILLEDRTGRSDETYTKNGNVLLNDIFGATMETRPGDQGLNMNAEMEALCEAIRAETGESVYGIVGGGSCPTGALGYVRAAIELLEQADERDIEFDHIVHATGSAGTQAGLAVGLKSVDASSRLLGFGVRAPRDVQEANVYNLALATCDKFGVPAVSRDDIVADCAYVGPGGYGVPTDATIEAIRIFARCEGALLDPVYSGKAAAGLIDYCRRGVFKKGERVCFLHTGGSSSLHGYLDSFA